MTAHTPRYQLAAADRTWVYAIDDTDFPVDVLSEHEETDDAWTAFHAANAEAAFDTIVFLFDIRSDRTIVASSDDDDPVDLARAGA